MSYKVNSKFCVQIQFVRKLCVEPEHDFMTSISKDMTLFSFNKYIYFFPDGLLYPFWLGFGISFLSLLQYINLYIFIFISLSLYKKSQVKSLLIPVTFYTFWFQFIAVKPFDLIHFLFFYLQQLYFCFQFYFLQLLLLLLGVLFETMC